MPSVSLSVCLLVCLSVCLYFCLSVYLSVCLSVCLFVCLSVCISVYLFVCLSICLSVCLSVHLYVCLTESYLLILSVYSKSNLRTEIKPFTHQKYWNNCITYSSTQLKLQGSDTLLGRVLWSQREFDTCCLSIARTHLGWRFLFPGKNRISNSKKFKKWGTRLSMRT